MLWLMFVSFISLGIPDSFLGAAWPSMWKGLGVELSRMGVLTVIFAIGKVAASAVHEVLDRRLGTGRLVLFSVLVTMGSLFGFAFSHSFFWLCVWAVPYGLASGAASTAINKYVALHYENRHMNWLHCMWGIGASLGPYVVALAVGRATWNAAWLWGGILLAGLSVLLMFSLPRWKSSPAAQKKEKPLCLGEMLRLPGLPWILGTFFCYCALEQATALWAASFLVLDRGADAAAAAGYAGLFFIGVTVGRALSGFTSARLSDDQMVLLGQGVALVGVLLLLQPWAPHAAVPALAVMGLGCAPMMPSLLHATPAHFGEAAASSVMGLEMAFANAGTLVMPPLFGWLAALTGVGIYPWFLLVILGLMALTHRMAVQRCRPADRIA